MAAWEARSFEDACQLAGKFKLEKQTTGLIGSFLR
jgi:hypothetical protein